MLRSFGLHFKPPQKIDDRGCALHGLNVGSEKVLQRAIKRVRPRGGESYGVVGLLLKNPKVIAVSAFRLAGLVETRQSKLVIIFSKNAGGNGEADNRATADPAGL